MTRISPTSISRWACGLLAGLALATVTHASQLFYQAPQTVADLYLSGTLQTGTEQSAESFRLGQSATVTHIRWWGSRISDTSDLKVRFFADPEVDELAFSLLDGPITQTSTGNLDVFQFDLTLTPTSTLSLTAGDLYYLSVFAGDFEWGWQANDDPAGVSGVREDNSQAWDFSQPPNLAFELIGEFDGTVPEPSALALSVLALAAAAHSSRRRRMR